MYKLHSVGDRTEICVKPALIYLCVDISPYTRTLKFHFERNEQVNLIRLVEHSNLQNLCSHKVSKAFSISKNTADVDDNLLLKLRLTLSVSPINFRVVL
jgi:hypothetical protein